MIIGTAGHIDHGKTALVKALTGVETDRLAEEKARGITIELGFAYADWDGRRVGFVDVPGHERFVHTMLAGTGGIDLALLVVAADDGVMPQTREHLAILHLLGVKTGVIAISKADLADAARRTTVEAEIRALTQNTALADAPIIAVSARTGEGLADLRAALLSAGDAGPDVLPAVSHDADPANDPTFSHDPAFSSAPAPFRMSVDRSFSLQGVGTIVTGTIIAGQVRVGDTVMISPAGRMVRVRGLRAHDRPAEEARHGARVALHLAGVAREDVRRGDMILDPALHAPTARVDAELTTLSGEPRALGTWFPARLHTHAAEVGARLVPLNGDIAPGQTGLVQLVLDAPLALTQGDRFILRDVSASRTIGGGRFLDLRAPARKRRHPARLALLEAMARGDLHQQLALAPLHVEDTARDLGLTVAQLCARLDGKRIGPLILSPDMARGISALLLSTLTEFHAANPDLPGMGRERLRLALTPRLPKDAFTDLLHQMAGEIVREGAFVRLPGHSVTLSEEDEAIFDRILPHLLGEGRFRPPRVRDFAGLFGIEETEIRRILRMTQRLGRTDQIAHDHFFARPVTTEMVGIIQDIAAQSDDGWFTAPAFRDRVQNGRKVAIEILDFFDRHGVTLRRGDLRRINPHRVDLFTPA